MSTESETPLFVTKNIRRHSIMDNAPSFSSFLFAAFIASFSVGGSFLISWGRDDRETLKQIAILTTEVGHTNKELEKILTQQQFVNVLGTRVTVLETEVSKQNLALEELRKSRVPTDMREYRK